MQNKGGASRYEGDSNFDNCIVYYHQGEKMSPWRS